MVDITEEDKMMLRRLIVKEDELEELKMELGRTRTNADYSLEAKATRLIREIKELREKLEEVCGE